MTRQTSFALATCVLVFVASHAGAQARAGASSLTLTPTTALEAVNTRAVWTEYRGRRALQLAPLAGQEQATDQEMWAVIVGSEFSDGTIEVDVAGARRAGYATDNASAYKGFIGVSFRVRGDTAERFYVRTENARLDDQLFRNRTTQYEAPPDAPWQVLRRESPGRYESHADMEAGAWTRLRIEVVGRTARLYVNGAPQPALVVTDLKHGDSRGAIALWTRISADAYFSDLRVTPGPVPAYPAPEPAGAGSVAWTAAQLPRLSEVINGAARTVTYRERPAVRLSVDADKVGAETAVLAMLDGPAFTDGTIEMSLAGVPRADAPADSRGFVGVSFRTGPRGEWSEVFYLRPLNARAGDQLRRNRSVQYASDPDFPWHRLREEQPGTYEAYADMGAGEWTTIRVDVRGTTARLFVNGAAQPSLVVTDLKRGTVGGGVALWAHAQTDAYFGPVSIIRR